ncbi:MAG: S41 family peptidase [Bacteroidota bacterium]
MRLKKIFPAFLLVFLLSCNFVTQAIYPPTATLIPTATATLTASPTPTATAVPIVPAYIPQECASRPLATVAPEALVVPTEENQANAEISESEQMGILQQVDEIVRKVYVYPDFNGKNWNEIEARYKSKVEAGLGADDFYMQMENMIEELGDEHSFFLSPLEVKKSEAELKGENDFVGIGVYTTPDVDRRRLVVISTFPGSAAAYAGIEPHDSILQVDGQPVIDENHNLLRGPACSAMMVTVQSPGEAARQIMLVRHAIKGNLRIDARLVHTTDGSKIGYIFIPTFFDETIPRQVEDALNQFGTLNGLILDLRMNGGGSSTVANPILSFFTAGRLGQFVSRDESRPLGVDPDPIQNSQTVPMVVMVSQDTVSYGEIFAGIMRDSRHAKITGETSLGNVEVLHGFNFDDGSQLWLASERFFPAHSDENWEETGIVPDVQAYAPWDTFNFDNDPSVAEAVKLLGH